MDGFADEAMLNGQQIADAMLAASRDVIEMTQDDCLQFVHGSYEYGTTVYRILEGLMETVCVLLAVAPVRMKKTGERSYLRPGFRLLSDTNEFHMRVRAVERSTVPSGVLSHILPLVQMLAIVPLGIDVPKCGLVLREWCISMSDFHNAKAKGAAESATLESLLQQRSKGAPRGGPAGMRPNISPSPRAKQSPGHASPPAPQYTSPSPVRSLSPMQSMSPQSQPRRSLSPEAPVAGVRVRSPPSPKSPKSPRSPRSPPALNLNTTGGALHVGGTWARSPTGRSPRGRSPRTPQQQPVSPRSQASPRSRTPQPVSPRSGLSGGRASHPVRESRSLSRSPASGRRDSVPAAYQQPELPQTPPHLRGPSGQSVPVVGSAAAAALRQSSPLSAHTAAGLPPLPPPSPRMAGGGAAGAGAAGPPPSDAELHRHAKVVREMTPAERDALVRLTATSQDPGNRVMTKSPVRLAELDYARGVSLEGPDGYVAASPPQSPPRAHVPQVQPVQHAVHAAAQQAHVQHAPPPHIPQQHSPWAPPLPAPQTPRSHAPVSPREMREADLRQWLIIRGMERYYDTLNQHGIYLVEDLQTATDATLSFLPIGPKRKLLAYASGKLRP